MYEEWMDAIPLLVDGCPEYNVGQLRRAQEYHKRHGDNDRVNRLEKRIDEELQKISYEEIKLSLKDKFALWLLTL